MYENSGEKIAVSSEMARNQILIKNKDADAEVHNSSHR